MKRSLYEHVQQGIRNAIERSSALSLARDSGVRDTTVGRWAKGERGEKGIASLCSLLESIGARIVFPEDIDSDCSCDVMKKNVEIARLNGELEKSSIQITLLEGKILAYKEMMNELKKDVH